MNKGLTHTIKKKLVNVLDWLGGGERQNSPDEERWSDKAAALIFHFLWWTDRAGLRL